MTAPEANPFPGPRPYTSEEEHLYFGRDADLRRLVDAVVVNRCVTLYGPSSAGKSSLMQAKVIPRLKKDKRMRAVSIAEWPPDQETPPAAHLVHALSKQLGVRGKPGARPADALDLAAQRSSQPILVYLDQLEQLLGAERDPDRGGEFWDAVEAMANRPDLEVHVVLALREDHLGLFRHELRDHPGLIAEALRLGPFTVREMAGIVTLAAAQGGQAWDAEQMKAMLRRMVEQKEERQRVSDQAEVESVYVQICCQEIFHQRHDIPKEGWSAELDPQRILDGYLERTLNEPSLAEAARVFLMESLIDGRGRRKVLTDENLEEVMPDADVRRRVVEHLVKAAIVSRGRHSTGRVFYELGHDWLAAKVFELRKVREKEEADREAERARHEEEEQRRREQEEAAKQARIEAQAAQLRARFWQTAFALIVVVLALGTTVTVLEYQRVKTGRERDDAEIRALKAERDKQVERIRTRLREAQNDDAVRAIAREMESAGIKPDDVRDAADEYWRRRAKRLEQAARDLDGDGCVEEAAVVRAYAAAGAPPGDAGTPAPVAPELTGVLWLAAPAAGGTENERCKARRTRTCDRVTLIDGAVSASCTGKLEVFDAEGRPTSHDGAGTRRVPLGAMGDWSVGVDGARLLVNHGTSAVPLPVCPKQGSYVLAFEARATDKRASLAFACSEGTYGTLLIPDLDAWFATRGAPAPQSSHGFGVRAVAWAGDDLLTVRSGGGGVDVVDGAGFAASNVYAIAGSASFAVFGTERSGGPSEPPFLGVLALADHKLAERKRWPLPACAAPWCVVRAVAAGPDEGHFAGLLVDLSDDGKPLRSWLVLSDKEQPRLIELAGENPGAVTIGAHGGQLVTAVPLSGRVRLYGWEPQRDGSWEATQRRLGLTVRHGHGVRVERVDDVGLLPAPRLDDVFASK